MSPTNEQNTSQTTSGSEIQREPHELLLVGEIAHVVSESVQQADLVLHCNGVHLPRAFNHIHKAAEVVKSVAQDQASDMTEKIVCGAIGAGAEITTQVAAGSALLCVTLPDLPIAAGTAVIVARVVSVAALTETAQKVMESTAKAAGDFTREACHAGFAMANGAASDESTRLSELESLVRALALEERETIENAARIFSHSTASVAPTSSPTYSLAITNSDQSPSFFNTRLTLNTQVSAQSQTRRQPVITSASVLSAPTAGAVLHQELELVVNATTQNNREFERIAQSSSVAQATATFFRSTQSSLDKTVTDFTTFSTAIRQRWR